MNIILIVRILVMSYFPTNCHSLHIISKNAEEKRLKETRIGLFMLLGFP